MKSIFLDYNATTPIAPQVQEAMLPFLAEYFATPEGHYPPSRAIAEALEDARGQVAHLLNVTSDEIVFCASGTESCNHALKGIAFEYLARGEPCHLIISAVEHAAVTQAATYCQHMGCELSILPVDRSGKVDPQALADALRPETRLVSIMLANDETGVLQPIPQLAAICRKKRVLFHTDACQAVGKIQVHPAQLGVDLLSLSGHKFYGPKGAAALFVRAGTPLAPLIHGNGNEHSLRAGHENVPAWIGLGKAANLAGKSLDAAAEKFTLLSERLIRKLMAAIPERLVLHGAQAERLPNTLCLNFPGISGYELLRRVPEIHAATWAGGAVDAGNSSAVLAAMGVPDTDKQGTLRLSLGWYTCDDEVDRAAELLIGAWESLRP